MSSEKLKDTLQKEIRPTGSYGFEELSKRLLELVFGEKFILARSGDQPTGDAHSAGRSVCIQAKRYSGRVPSSTTIEGDFDRCLRNLPNTDIYVLAITLNSTQLDNTLDAMREKSAVDVVVLDFGSSASTLQALCVEYWDQLLDFPAIQKVESDLMRWVHRVRRSRSHKETFEQVKRALRDCTQTHSTIRQAACAYLSSRFQILPKDTSLQSQSIKLSEAVERSHFQAQARDWWSTNQTRVLVLNAPEGFGKTWVAAQCSMEISESDDAVVLWLDSLHWRQCCSVDAVLEEAVSRIVVAEPHKIRRLVRKLRQRWSARTLIVLDGVTERNALPAAQSILDDLSSKHPGSCRIVFTTRPIDSARGFESGLWKWTTKCDIHPFDDSELSEALSMVGIPPEEMTDQLRSIARIPRYFKTCVRLRERLNKLDNVSVPLVLWTDLLEKIDGLEPEIRQTLGVTSETDAIDVLVKLTTKLPAAVQSGDAQKLLDSCFEGRYSAVRSYLLEIRLLEKAGKFDAELSRDHSILGRALLLRQVLLCNSSLETAEIADRLIQTLEPLADEDGSAESLYVALQLSVTQKPVTSSQISQERAALLYTWVMNHNSNATDEKLGFWCEFDPRAYARFLEVFFEQRYAGNTEDYIVNPIARVWIAGANSAAELMPYFRKWLLLVWFEGCSGEQYSNHGHSVPIAMTMDQVRLSSLVVSLLTLRPDKSFLTDLALCLSTNGLSWIDVDGHEFKFKSVFENVGVLMRWHYTEAVLSDIDALTKTSVDDALLLNGLQLLAATLRLVEVPNLLQLPPVAPFPYYLGTPAVEMIRNNQSVFGGRQEKPYPNELDFGNLAVRDDLPSLIPKDIEWLGEAIKHIDSGSFHSSRQTTSENLRVDPLWPWFAKHYPNELAKLAGDFQLRSLGSGSLESTEPIFWFLAGMVPKLNDEKAKEWKKLANQNAAAMEVVNGRLENYLGLSVAETALFFLDQHAVHEWVLESAKSEGRRYSMCFAPIMDLIPFVISEKTRAYVVQKCLDAVDTKMSADRSPPTEFDYWCYLASLTAGRSQELYEWSKSKLADCEGDKEGSFSIYRMLLRSAPAGALEKDLNGPGAQSLLNQRCLRAWVMTEGVSFDPKLVHGTFDQLKRNYPINFVGYIVSLGNRIDDLKKWGDELFLAAIKNLGQPPIERRSRVASCFGLGANRMIEEEGFENPRSESWSQNSTTGWWGGIQNSSIASGLCDQMNRQDLLDQELDRWRKDSDEIRGWEHYDLHAFGAWNALEKWSEIDTDKFLRKAKKLLLGALENSPAQWHLGGYLNALVCCVLPLDPRLALKYYEAFNDGRLNVKVRTRFQIPEFFNVLWDRKTCNLPEHVELRRFLLARCENDFEIMVFCIAALANSGESVLVEFARELLKEKNARDRSLGVSILAWLGSVEPSGLLCDLVASDPSRWVREHANWANEVCLQEMSARKRFREIVRQIDLYAISTQLQVLKPALTPVAKWWRHAIQSEEEQAGNKQSGRPRAIVESFWYHVESTSSTSVKICGRKLEEFCRGEKLDSHKTPRLSPWWKPKLDFHTETSK